MKKLLHTKKRIGALAADPYVLGLGKCMGTRDESNRLF